MADPPKRPPPVPDDAVKTDPDSPFAPPPPTMPKGKFTAPPAEPSKYDWNRVEYGKAPIATGPPKILGLVCSVWVLFSIFQLWVWLPEEVGGIPGCPGMAGITTLILAVYAWSGR